MLTYFIKNKKRNQTIYQALKCIFGIGNKKIIFTCKTIGLLTSSSFNSLTTKQLAVLSIWLDNNIVNKSSIGIDFKNQQLNQISFLKKSGSFRGTRLLKKLPARGQRTRTNAQTCRSITF